MASPSILEAALQYGARGWPVLPLYGIDESGHCRCKRGAACDSPGKHPCIRTGKAFAAASCEPAQIHAWFDGVKGERRNLGLPTGGELAVVDVDGAEGVATLRQLLAGRQLDPTLMAVSGREGGGRHLYLYANRAPTNSGAGLDIRGEGGLVVAPPSMHASGKRYHWLDASADISDMPAWMLDWFRARPGGAKRTAHSDAKVPEYLRAGALPRLADRAADGMEELPDPDDLAAVVALIANDNRGWEDWNRLGMAIWAASGGADYGLSMFHMLSAKSKKYDEDATTARWQHYANSPPNAIGFGTLVHEAREIDPTFTIPSREPKMVPEQNLAPEAKETPQEPEFFKPGAEEFNGHKSLAQLFAEIDLDKPGNPLIKLNQKFAAIGDLGGKCLVMSWVDSKVDRTVKVPSFQSFKSFSERYAHKYVTLKSQDEDGQTVEEVKSLGAYWLKWGHRRTFEGIDLVPNGERELPGKVLNLWQGFAIEPKPGAWPLMRAHILDVLAAGDRPSADYIARWAAWAVQHPGERAEAALVLKGGKGSGKGTFADAMRQIFGQHGLHIFNSKHLVGAFNGHLRNCLFLFADEAFWAGDKHGEAVLKGMLTEPVLMIEQKGIDATAWKNRLHVIMAANAEWVVPASHDERRYAVFEVSSSRMGDEAYFAALRAEMVSGGLAAMLHDLLAYDLKGWHPRKIVRTAALAEQKARSLDPRHEWWESVLQSGVLPGKPDATHGVIPATTVYDRARDDVPKLKEASATALGRFLRGFGAEGLHRENGNYWRFPNLIEARRLWAVKFGQWPWRNTLTDWHP
jgi:hypothetical protein